MSLFSGGQSPDCPDFDKTLDSAAGAVTGAAAITFKPGTEIDGLKLNNMGKSKDYAIRLTLNPAAGYTINGDQTMLIPAGYTDSITFDDRPSDGDAVESIVIELVDLSGITAGNLVVASALPAAPATDATGAAVFAPFFISSIES